MIIKGNKITLILEDEEIEDFWNIIAFALDYDNKGNVMTDAERKMARELYDITDGLK